MPDIIFARPRTPYDSYQDFLRLIELSGFPLIYTDEIDADSDNVYIYSPSNGDTRNGWPGAKARIIHYQLEWETHPNDQHPLDPGVSEKWTHDAWHAERIGARYVPIGSHPDLAGYWGLFRDDQGQPEHVWVHYVHRYKPEQPKYDVAMMAYMTNRRIYIQAEAERKGITFAPNAWEKKRCDLLNESRAMLHVHQHDDVPGVASLRLVVAAAYRLPVITETCADYGIFDNSTLLMSQYNYLVDFTESWLKPECAARLADYGEALHGLLCVEHTFRKVIEGAV